MTALSETPFDDFLERLAAHLDALHPLIHPDRKVCFGSDDGKRKLATFCRWLMEHGFSNANDIASVAEAVFVFATSAPGSEIRRIVESEVLVPEKLRQLEQLRQRHRGSG